MSVDPRDRYKAQKNPQVWNRYSYANSNPMKYIDPNGEEATVFIIGPEPGGSRKSAFGHSAIFVTYEQRKAGLSYGGRHGFERGVKAFVRAYLDEGRKVTILVLRTTDEQDKKMVDFIEQNRQGDVDRDALGANVMLVENCTTAVCNTLKEGGVLEEGEDADGAMSGLHAPSELLESLLEGELEEDVEIVIEIEPEKE